LFGVVAASIVNSSFEMTAGVEGGNAAAVLYSRETESKDGVGFWSVYDTLTSRHDDKEKQANGDDSEIDHPACLLVKMKSSSLQQKMAMSWPGFLQQLRARMTRVI